MSFKSRLGRLEQRTTELAPTEAPGVARARFFERLNGIRTRLLASPYPLPPVEEQSLAERLSLADTPEESQVVMTEVREKLRLC